MLNNLISVNKFSKTPILLKLTQTVTFLELRMQYKVIHESKHQKAKLQTKNVMVIHKMSPKALTMINFTLQIKSFIIPVTKIFASTISLSFNRNPFVLSFSSLKSMNCKKPQSTSDSQNQCSVSA